MLSNLLSECLPVPFVRRCHVPHVTLQYSLADGRARIGLVGPIDLGQLAALSERCVVNSLENVAVELLSLFAVERVAHQNERVSKTLNTDSHRTVLHV
ncbi:hypothetical protein BpHYR1_023804 [Brachionus plicatilis]|uniref:Uncharacterized protein n=1 Tax=Brachionus plicatilis TaxID=10195 RepID=A0A3M7PED3_BRAPC|nr:hypothetical protein BpHYR1_023804 [Brachionus plicatilis]